MDRRVVTDNRRCPSGRRSEEKENQEQEGEEEGKMSAQYGVPCGAEQSFGAESDE